MKIINVCAAIIIDNEQKILITRRAAKEAFAGGWEFPGGKIEPNESASEALVRELQEELGISVLIEKKCTEVLHHYDHFSVHIQAFYCRILCGTLKLSVHDNLQWVTKNELLNYELLAADIPIAEKIIKDLTNEQN